MKECAMAYCAAGENCSRAILLAAADCYGFSVSEELFACCNAIRAGFGIGGICSSIVAGIMVLGILFDEVEAKGKSLQFLCMAQGCWGCMDCCRLAAEREDCNSLIGEMAEILENIIGER